MNITEIAKTLNAEGIPAPLMHRRNINTQRGIIVRTVDEIPLWRPANVTRFLRDERYTGKNITGKTSKGKYGTKKTVFHPKSEWIVVPDAHYPIVTQETFDKVQAILGPYNARKIKKANTNILAGKIFCVRCRHTLRRYGGLDPKYVCRSSIRKFKTQYEKLYAEYQAIKKAGGLFTERKAQKALTVANEYYENNRDKILGFENAERYLKDVLGKHFDGTKLPPITKWTAERDKLNTEHLRINAGYKQLKSDIASAEKIRSSVIDIMSMERRRGQPQRLRSYDMEL